MVLCSKSIRCRFTATAAVLLTLAWVLHATGTFITSVCRCVKVKQPVAVAAAVALTAAVTKATVHHVPTMEPQYNVK